MIVRRAFVEGCGVDERGLWHPTRARPWTRAVTRLALLAGMNRGWTVAPPVSRPREGLVRLSTGIAHLLSAIREPTLFAIRRGAPFLTTTRPQWLALPADLRPVTVQLLGTRDDLVSPADNVDLATGAAFHYLEVPASGHFDVVDMSERDLEGRRARRETGYRQTVLARQEQLRQALTASSEHLRAIGIAPEELADGAP